LKITEQSLPFYIPAFSISAAVAAAMGGMQFTSPVGRSVGYLALLGSLLCLFRITGREDIAWLLGLLRKK